MSGATASPRLLNLINVRDRIEQEIARERAALRRLAQLEAEAREAARATTDHKPHPTAPAVDVVLAVVANRFDITTADITGVSRVAPIAAARAVTAWLLRAAGYSVIATGQALNRDHSTISHSHARVEGDPELLTVAYAIRHQLTKDAA